jgi:hypothetical protein
VHSHTSVIIPLHDRVIFVSLLNCAEFSSRLSEVAQPFDAISGIQFLGGRGGLSELMASWHGLSQVLRRGMTGVGWGTLFSLGIGLFVMCVIFDCSFQEA